MSLNVLVIPEDFTKDEHVLKPLVEAILRDAGKPEAHVEVCRDPNFKGISEALKLDRLRTDVIARYHPMVKLFILIVDRDGEPGREDSIARLKRELAADLNGRGTFLAELARQEVEVFILAGHDLPGGWRWQEIREDADVKNTYFRQLAELKGTTKLPYEGRKKLMVEAMKNWIRIKQLCQEEVGGLITTCKALFQQ